MSHIKRESPIAGLEEIPIWAIPYEPRDTSASATETTTEDEDREAEERYLVEEHPGSQREQSELLDGSHEEPINLVVGCDREGKGFIANYAPGVSSS